MIFKLNNENFDSQVFSGLKLIAFETSWCKYCQQQDEILNDMDRVWIGKVDGDKSQYLVQRFHIKSYPSFLVLKDGKEVLRFSGVYSKFDIMNMLMQFL